MAGKFRAWMWQLRCVRPGSGQHVSDPACDAVGRVHRHANLYEGHRADLPGQVRGVPSPRTTWRRCRSSPTRTRGRGPVRSRCASSSRQMPPWHIDKTVGIQQFKNDRSLSDEQIDTIVRWVDSRRAERRSEGHAGAEALAGRKQVAVRRQVRAARISSSSPRRTRCRPPRRTPGGAQSPRPGSPSRDGFAPSRSVPSTEKGRKVTHHALARLQQPENMRARTLHERSRTSSATASSWNGPSARTATRCARIRAA